MLTGETPFTGSNATEILLAHVMKEPPPPRSRRPDIPEPLEALILQCLAKDPAGRPEEMGQVGERLQAIVAAAPPDAVTPAPPRADPSHSVVMTGEAGSTDPLAATCATPAVAASAVAPAAPTPATPAPLPPTIATSPGTPVAQTVAAGGPAPGRRGLLVMAALGVAMVVAGGVVAALILRGDEKPPPRAAASGAPGTSTADAAVIARAGSADSSAPAAVVAPTAAVAPDDAATSPEQGAPAEVKKPVRRAHRRPSGSRRRKADGHDDQAEEPVKASNEPDEKKTEEPRAPKPPRRTHVVVRTVPTGAAVVREGKKIGNTPLSIPVPRRQRLVISFPGFRTRMVDIGPTSAAELKLTLERIGNPHKSFSRLEADYRARRINIIRYNVRKARLEHQRNAELAEAKERYDRGELKWKQYMQLRDRIYDSYR
jgi:hypothetical protein